MFINLNAHFLTSNKLIISTKLFAYLRELRKSLAFNLNSLEICDFKLIPFWEFANSADIAAVFLFFNNYAKIIHKF